MWITLITHRQRNTTLNNDFVRTTLNLKVRYPFLPPCSLNYHFTIHSPSRGPGSEDMLEAAPLHVHPLRAGEAPGTMWYRVKGDFCQLGLFCFLPFGPCSKSSALATSV